MNTDQYSAIDDLKDIANILKEQWPAMLGVASPIIYYITLYLIFK